MAKKYAIFSFFSGIGFLDLGFEKTGFPIVQVNEIHKPFLEGYIYSRNGLSIKEPRFGYDLCDINDYLSGNFLALSKRVDSCRKQNELVGFIGGPPCPDFSIAGKQAGKNGKNGQLSFSYIKLISQILPDFFVFENVKGLWSTKKHRQYYDGLKDYIGKNYLLTESLCNALEYGVPQDRSRILLFGVSKKIANSVSDFNWKSYAKYNFEEIKKRSWPTVTPFQEDSLLPCPNGVVKELTVQHWFTKNRTAEHPNSGRHFTPRSGLQKMKTIAEGDVSRKSYKRLHRWRFSPTAAYGNNEIHLHPYKARRLDIAETLAIQSLPKQFSLPNNMTLSDSFKAVGNGVPYLLAKSIAATIYDWMEIHG